MKKSISANKKVSYQIIVEHRLTKKDLVDIIVSKREELDRYPGNKKEFAAFINSFMALYGRNGLKNINSKIPGGMLKIYEDSAKGYVELYS